LATRAAAISGLARPLFSPIKHYVLHLCYFAQPFRCLNFHRVENSIACCGLVHTGFVSYTLPISMAVFNMAYQHGCTNIFFARCACELLLCTFKAVVGPRCCLTRPTVYLLVPWSAAHFRRLMHGCIRCRVARQSDHWLKKPILDYRAYGSGVDPGFWQSACR